MCAAQGNNKPRLGFWGTYTSLFQQKPKKSESEKKEAAEKNAVIAEEKNAAIAKEGKELYQKIEEVKVRQGQGYPSTEPGYPSTEPGYPSTELGFVPASGLQGRGPAPRVCGNFSAGFIEKGRIRDPYW